MPTSETKIFLGIIGATILLVTGAALFFGRGTSSTSTGTISGQQAVSKDVLVRPDSWSLGSPSAKITLVEFSDFQCPSCKAADPDIKSLLQKYPDQIYLVYRFFPLPSHEFGLTSALAAEAAGRQGKFWEYHDKLFDNQPDFARDKLIGYAKDLGLDEAKFTADLDSDSVRQHVLNNQTDGNKIGVDATPTFYVNGTKLVGTADLDSTVVSALRK